MDQSKISQKSKHHNIMIDEVFQNIQKDKSYIYDLIECDQSKNFKCHIQTALVKQKYFIQYEPTSSRAFYKIWEPI